MGRLLEFIAKGMAAYMDFGMGILITSLTAYGMGVVLEPWQLIIGGFLAFLPDMDIVWLLLTGQKHKIPLHHTMPLHRPLFVIPVVTMVAWYVFGTFWGVVTFLCVTYHYMHDTKGPLGGAGLQWFWPISKMEWTLRGPEPLSQHLNPTLDEWLTKEWLRPSRLSLFEIGLGTFALISGVALSYNACAAFAIGSAFLFGAFVVWYLNEKEEKVD